MFVRKIIFICLFINTVSWSQVELIQTDTVQEVVVTATRNVVRKLDVPVAVSVIDGKLIARTASQTLSESLSFAPGIRTETDCQTCNYTQVRMNGLGGSYTQILLNGRPLFSSLMGLYGLEQIPTNAIERIEIVRGGGSVLYGSSAIAGTINVITKVPKNNLLSVTSNLNFIGMKVPDFSHQLNGTLSSRSGKTGITLFASQRNREGFDVNSDGFTELPALNGQSIGTTIDQQLGKQWRAQVGCWYLGEKRRGGDRLDLKPEEASQGEFRDQQSFVSQANLNWKAAVKPLSVSFFGGLAQTKRKHYTGIDQAEGWGNTRATTLQVGTQSDYTSYLKKTKMEWVVGAETTIDRVNDEIPGYNYFIDQESVQHAVFAQQLWVFNARLSLLSGLRFTHHSRSEKSMFTPRFALLYKWNGQWQARIAYGRGFKAPQAFETDLHIAFSGGGISTIQLDPNLKSEIADAWSTSIDWNRRRKRSLYSAVISGFYSTLYQPFVLQELSQDTSGNTLLFRTNGSTAKVYGTTAEFRWKWYTYLQSDLGFTLQRSFYAHAQSWSQSVPGTTSFLRTPNSYGYASFTLFPDRKWNASLNAVYTGKMFVPHFGGAPGQLVDQLKVSPTFFDLSVRIQRQLHWHKSEQTVFISCGIFNILNSYQSDFDTTKNRDSNYIYGPSKPRTAMFQLKWMIAEKEK